MKIISTLGLLLIIGCQPAKTDQVDLKALKNEVFDIHDEVMPKMGDLRRVRKELMLKADSLRETDSTKAQFLLAASNQIGAANEGMMVWMRNFNPDSTGTYQEELDYLNQQKKGIIKVRDDMNSSLVEGKKILKKDF